VPFQPPSRLFCANHETAPAQRQFGLGAWGYVVKSYARHEALQGNHLIGGGIEAHALSESQSSAHLIARADSGRLASLKHCQLAFRHLKLKKTAFEADIRFLNQVYGNVPQHGLQGGRSQRKFSIDATLILRCARLASHKNHRTEDRLFSLAVSATLSKSADDTGIVACLGPGGAHETPIVLLEQPLISPGGERRSPAVASILHLPWVYNRQRQSSRRLRPIRWSVRR